MIMKIYDYIKNFIQLIQKSDNLEITKQLDQLHTRNLDLQKQNTDLRNENNKLKSNQDLENRIIRHPEMYITLKGDDLTLRYCAHCWDSERLTIQLNCKLDASFVCPHCGTIGLYDYQKYKNIINL